MALVGARCDVYLYADRDGCVRAPPRPGLGIRLDWQAIEMACILVLEVKFYA